MTIKIRIDLGNEAMRTADDVAQLLRNLAYKIEDKGSDFNEEDFLEINLRDVNGNTVGKCYSSNA